MTELIQPLNIFPLNGLSSSVITTVWIGVFVICFFNLRLGWTFSGLVVPGYLVPLIITKPWAALVIVVESVLTYGLVVIMSERFSKFRGWSSFFGRDRFFAFVLFSLVIRIIMDGWLLPVAGDYINNVLGLQFDYKNNLHSFGLIIIALIGNYFWKSGIRKGLFTFSVNTALTYLIVRYILMVYTNFSIGRIEYMYEDIALSIIAGPKAYIIILVTCFMASRMNLKYGWEFSGIMIPSLLALHWYQPLKLVTTIAETLIILFLAHLILKLPVFRKITLEGARKILLFFNVSFFYKLIMGHMVNHFWPEIRISDYYGFGYLLTTMIAVKMYQKSLVPEMTRSILQTSFVSVVIASAAGFFLTFIPSPYSILDKPENTQIALSVKNSESLSKILSQEKIMMHGSITKNSYNPPSEKELDIFSEAIQAAEKYVESRHSDDFSKCFSLLNNINYNLSQIENSLLVMTEKLPKKGRGIFVLDMDHPSGISIEIPAPADEWVAMEAGYHLFRNMKGKAMAIAGTSRFINWDGSADVTHFPASFFNMFHKIISPNNTLQVRTLTDLTYLTIKESIKHDIEDEDSFLYVKSRLPEGLNLSLIENSIDHLYVLWEKPPIQSIQRELSWDGFAELYLTKQQCQSLYISSIINNNPVESQQSLQRIDGYLMEWILASENRIAVKGSNSYIPPTIEESLYLDHEVIGPIVEFKKHVFINTILSKTEQESLKAIQLKANALNYSLSWYHHLASDSHYLILDELDNEKRKFWGTYIFRLTQSSPYLVQIPRPLYERNSFEFGVRLFEQIQGEVLFIGGCHPNANQDGSSDLTRYENRMNALTLSTQSVLKHIPEKQLLLIQCRAFGYKPENPYPSFDGFISFSNGTTDEQFLSDESRQLLNTLRNNQMQLKFTDGSRTTMGYELSSAYQIDFLNAFKDKEMAVIWLSPDYGRHYKTQFKNNREIYQFEAAGIQSIEEVLPDLLFSIIKGKTKKNLNKHILDTINIYLETKDVAILRFLATNFRKYSLKRIVDSNSGQSFLLILPPENGLPYLVNLNPRIDSTQLVNISEANYSTVQSFIDSHQAWLSFEEEKP